MNIQTILKQLTFSQMIERIQRLEIMIHNPKTSPCARMACQHYRDKLYALCVEKIDVVLTDAAFSVFLSLGDSSININP